MLAPSGRLEAAELCALRERSPNFTAELWRPSRAKPFAPGRRDPRILSYSLMHAAGAFQNSDFGMIMLRAPDGAIAHSSMIMPGFSRFPFMERSDLQIGATKTPLQYRGKGLAVRAIYEAIALLGRDRRYWYLTESANTASVRVIEKARFILAGTGTKASQYGLPLLGAYRIDSTGESPFR